MINLKLQQKHHKSKIWSVAVSPQKDFFVTCSSDKNILIHKYPLDNTPPIFLPTQHSKTLRYLAFHPTKPMLACSSFDSTVSIYNYYYKENQVSENEFKNLTFEETQVLDGQETELRQICFSNCQDQLVTCSRDSVWIYDQDFDCQQTLNFNTDTKCSIFTNTNLLLIGTFSGHVYMYYQEDADQDFTLLKTLEIGTTVWDIKQAGDQIIVCDDNGFIWVYDISNFDYECIEEEDFEGDRGVNLIMKTKAHERACLSIDVCEGFMVSVGGDNNITLYIKNSNSLEGYSQVDSYKNAHKQDINQVRFIQNDVFITVGDDQMVKIWEIN